MPRAFYEDNLQVTMGIGSSSTGTGINMIEQRRWGDSSSLEPARIGIAAKQATVKSRCLRETRN